MIRFLSNTEYVCENLDGFSFSLAAWGTFKEADITSCDEKLIGLLSVHIVWIFFRLVLDLEDIKKKSMQDSGLRC